MAITEKQQERIDRFKAAFKSIAAAKNKGIRWTQPKNRLQTRTSLAAVDAALDLFRANPNATTLKGVTDAMGAVPPDRQAKYNLALEDLKKELDQTVIEAEPTLNGTLPVYKV
jgi:hypothetical protein